MITTSNWMPELDWTKKINRLTVPGTHDSGALYYVDTYDRCQEKTYLEQLKSGVRFLDIRLRYVKSAKGGINFAVHHSGTFQKSYFDDESDYSNDPETKSFVLRDCTTFLNANPSECIIMCIKQEYDPVDNKTFEDAFRELLQKDKQYNDREKMYFWVENRIPTLEEARGRIVLVNRLDDPATPKNPNYPDYKPGYGIIWPFWDKGIYQEHGVDVEDHYKDVTTAVKWGKVKDHLDKASGKAGAYGGDDDDFWYVTFVSCAPGNDSPKYWAEAMNPRLKGYLEDPANAPSVGKRLGTILMDFTPQDAINKIIEYSLKAYPAPNSVHRLVNTSTWTSRIDAEKFKPIRIAGGGTDNPYIIDSQQQVWFHNDKEWELLPGQKATDIGVGPDGGIWIVGAEPDQSYAGNFRIYKWDGSRWVMLPTGAGTHITVGYGDQVYIVNNQQEVWYYNGYGGNMEGKNWTKVPGVRAGDLDEYRGKVWAVGW